MSCAVGASCLGVPSLTYFAHIKSFNGAVTRLFFLSNDQHNMVDGKNSVSSRAKVTLRNKYNLNSQISTESEKKNCYGLKNVEEYKMSFAYPALLLNMQNVKL